MNFIDFVMKKLELKSKINDKEKEIKEREKVYKQYTTCQTNLDKIAQQLLYAKSHSYNAYYWLKYAISTSNASTYQKCNKVYDDVISTIKDMKDVEDTIKNEKTKLQTSIKNLKSEKAKLQKQYDNLTFF